MSIQSSQIMTVEYSFQVFSPFPSINFHSSNFRSVNLDYRWGVEPGQVSWETRHTELTHISLPYMNTFV